MATLTANPNPVGVQGPTGTGTTRITWNTQSTNPGRVFLTIDGGVRQPFAGGQAGARMGNQNRVVEFHHTYVFTLHLLDQQLELPADTPTNDLLAAVDAATAETATFTGTYERA